MKKYLKTAAFCLSLVLILGVIYITDFLTGYPVSYFIVKNAACEYIEENYPDTDFTACKPDYSLKLGGFSVAVKSPSSPDSYFSLSYSKRGELKYSTYEESIVEKGTTASRLSEEYKNLSRNVFESSNFPFEAHFSGDFTEAISGGKQIREEPGIYPHKWNTKELVLDKAYNISDLSSEYGTVYLNVTSDDVSIKTASEALLKLKEIMESAQLPFKSAELWVLSKEQDQYENPKEKLHILNFGWDEIYEENMEQRVDNAIKSTNEYFKR